MAIQKLTFSPKVYLIMFIVASALLMFIGGISYRQIDRLGKSAESVNLILEIGMQTNKLFSFYSQMQSSELKNRLLQDSTGISSHEVFMPETLQAFNRLKQLIGQKPEQQHILEKVGIWQDSLFLSLKEISEIDYKSPDRYAAADKNIVVKISNAITQLNLLRNQIYRVEQSELAKRKEEYASQISFTPLTTLVLGMFAMFIFVVSFMQINVLRKRTVRVDKFLQKILASSNNIISYFTPVYNDQEEITDFTIDFTNEKIEGDAVQAVRNNMSELIPANFENGIFEELTQVIQEGKSRKFEKILEHNGNKSWFSITASPMDDGVLTTSMNITAEKEASKNLENFSEQLQIQNSVLNDAEIVAKIGSYRHDLHSNKITMSDNFYRLLDCEVGEFIPSPENYRAFVHPNDFKLYKDKINLTGKQRPVPKFTYRIISKTGSIKHFQHSGHYIQNEFIGVVKDITKELKDDERLKDKNMELKRSNSELESFNHIASHDLQEPLRKIQIFISKIMEEESKNMSEKKMAYLDKINSSANRMQMLIKNLLAYSRLNKEKKGLLNVDLNEILEKVQEDLEAPIKEKNVQLSIQDLPQLQAVPFQMEQLFNNLLSNSIKYANIHTRPKITIDCQKIKTVDITETFNKKGAFYYCISISDNGIGFDQANSKKIFGLFQRLHQKHEYSGTGIGLAICKKIVENHKGHITADSTIGKGTTFRIYLPTK